jgi:hypothetical protein
MRRSLKLWPEEEEYGCLSQDALAKVNRAKARLATLNATTKRHHPFVPSGAPVPPRISKQAPRSSSTRGSNSTLETQPVQRRRHEYSLKLARETMANTTVAAADRLFGPFVEPIPHSYFDFTKLFEDSIFGIGPSGLLIIAASLRSAYLARAARKVHAGRAIIVKLVSPP